MIRTIIQLTEEQHGAIKAIAESQQVSVSKLIREQVAQYLVQHQVFDEQAQKRAQLLNWLTYQQEHPEEFSDIEAATDIALHHDKYLNEGTHTSW